MKFSSKARRELTLIVFCLTSLGLLGLLIFGRGGYLQVRTVRERLYELKKENHELRLENYDVRELIRRVQEDPAEIERIARKELNLAQPGDWIVTLTEPVPTP